MQPGLSEAITSSLAFGCRWSPLDANEGVDGETLLYVTLDCTETDLAEFEWVEEGKPYREWLMPAEIINRLGKIRVCAVQKG
jgi:hypothetical protein